MFSGFARGDQHFLPLLWLSKTIVEVCLLIIFHVFVRLLRECVDPYLLVVTETNGVFCAVGVSTKSWGLATFILSDCSHSIHCFFVPWRWNSDQNQLLKRICMISEQQASLDESPLFLQVSHQHFWHKSLLPNNALCFFHFTFVKLLFSVENVDKEQYITFFLFQTT